MRTARTFRALPAARTSWRRVTPATRSTWSVTAINSAGSWSGDFGGDGVVTMPVQPPVNTSLPTISGQTVVGDTLTAANGSWSNGPTGFAYQWQDCNSSGTNCSNISGATSSSYKLASGDAGDTIDVVVTACNSAGSGQASSAATAVVTMPVQPPVNTSKPTITGQTVVGDTLTASNGSWSNSPTGYGYQWQDCNSSGTNCSNISGATSSSYKLASGDAGEHDRRGRDGEQLGGEWSGEFGGDGHGDGSGAAAREHVEAYDWWSAAVGDTLTAANGSWSNSPTGYSYQWQDCNSSGANCSNISGATSSSYKLTSATPGARSTSW